MWNDPDRAASQLRLLLQSNALFQSRIRMLSENLRLHELLAKLDAKDGGCAALAARKPTGMPRGTLGPRPPEPSIGCGPPSPPHPRPGCARPGCCAWRLLLHQNRPLEAAALLSGGADRRAQDGLPNIEQAGAGFQDAATADLLEPLRSLIKERLGQEPRNPGSLELRAELAGQWSDTKAQLADYTAAIEALSRQTPEPTADLRRLYGRRGNAHVALKQWQQAQADYSRGVTDATTDFTLLSNQRRRSISFTATPRPCLSWSSGIRSWRAQSVTFSSRRRTASRGGKLQPRHHAGNDRRPAALEARHGHEALKNWEAAVADWSRAAAGDPDAARILAELGRATYQRRPGCAGQRSV